jgi:hypothetical protein
VSFSASSYRWGAPVERPFTLVVLLEGVFRACV